MRRFAPRADPGHGFQKSFKVFRVGVKRRKKIGPATLGLVLRFSGAERRREIAPKGIEPAIRHLQYSANIGWLPLIQKFIGGGSIANTFP